MEKTNQEKLDDIAREQATTFLQLGQLAYQKDCLHEAIGKQLVKLRNMQVVGTDLDAAITKEKAAKLTVVNKEIENEIQQRD